MNSPRRKGAEVSRNNLLALPRRLGVPAVILILAGCGYHVGGQGALMPKTIKTIAVPAFSNNTNYPKLARLLPADIAREFISRTHYTIVADPSQADAVLTGSLVNYASYGTVVDFQSGRATAAQLIVNLNITLTDRHTGKTLYTVAGAEFRERYEVSTDPQVYFDESGTAMERVARDVAQSVVSGILEHF